MPAKASMFSISIWIFASFSRGIRRRISAKSLVVGVFVSSNVCHLQVVFTTYFPDSHIRGMSFFDMAMMTLFSALDFSIVRPVRPHGTESLEFKSQCFETILNRHRKFLQVFQCSFSYSDIPHNMLPTDGTLSSLCIENFVIVTFRFLWLRRSYTQHLHKLSFLGQDKSCTPMPSCRRKWRAKFMVQNRSLCRC